MKPMQTPIVFLLAAGVLLPLALSYLWRYLAWSWPASEILFSPLCSEHKYDVEIISQTPLILYLDHFLTPSEIAHFLALGEPRLQRSVSPASDAVNAPLVDDPGRTSSDAPLDPSDPQIACVGKRALALTGGVPKATGDWGNPLLVRYEPSEQLTYHFDHWPEPQMRRGRLYNRLATFLIYLEDDCEGGETHFPYVDAGLGGAGNGSEVLRGTAAGGKLGKPKFVKAEGEKGVLFPPRKGSAVFWLNLDEDGEGDESTFHAGLPVKSGRKTVMNFWPPKYF